ncbi:MAG: hypothetical protein JWO06_3393 [Bacteroidota bacterium]|nr:hypothetical protein [Bacteroidota bacterium]
MLRRFLSVLAGVAVAMAIISLLEFGSEKLYPPPSIKDYNNAQALERIMSQMPVKAFLWLLVGYALGSFAGGATATAISGRQMSAPALITGGIVMIGGIMDLVQIPHPLWFVIVSLFMYIPFAALGYFVMKKKT